MPNPKPRTLTPITTTIAITLTTAITLTLYTHQNLKTLERKYPALRPETCTSRALRTPADPSSQHCPHVDVFAARVPVWVVERWVRDIKGCSSSSRDAGREITNKDIQDAWAKAFLGSRVMRAEMWLISLLSGWKRGLNLGVVRSGSGSDDEQNEDQNQNPIDETTFKIERSPSSSSSSSSSSTLPSLPLSLSQDLSPTPTKTGPGTNPDDTHVDHQISASGYLLSWTLPDAPRRFFQTLARFGYPWRLMSGGRHELCVCTCTSVPTGTSTGTSTSTPMSTSTPTEQQQENQETVTLLFSSAHDYQIVPDEGNLENQKVIPAWTERLHKAYGRFLVDRAVRELWVE